MSSRKRKAPIPSQVITEQQSPSISNEDDDLPSSSNSKITKSTKTSAAIAQKSSTLREDVKPPNLAMPFDSESSDSESTEEEPTMIKEGELFDVFVQEIIPAFADIDSFKNFACSRNGLRLSRLIVQTIVSNNPHSVEEQKLQMLYKWEERAGDDATIQQIRDVLREYRDVRSGKCLPTKVPALPHKKTLRHKSTLEGQRLRKRAKHPSFPPKMPDQSSSAQIKDELFDVYVQEIIPAFANINSFKNFACSKNGLRLSHHIVGTIVTNNPHSVEEQKLQMLYKWEELEGKEAPTSKIRDILQHYQEVQRTGNRSKLEQKHKHKATSAAKTSEGSFHDVFYQEVMPAFIDNTSFEKFARSTNGLGLDDYEIQTIVDDNQSNVEAQKFQMLHKWKELQRGTATIKQIRDILKRYQAGKLDKNEPTDESPLQQKMTLRRAIKPSRKGKQLLKDAKNISFLTGKKPDKPASAPLKANAIIIFNRKDMRLYSYKLLTRRWEMMQKFTGEKFTTVRLHKHIYEIAGKEVHQLEYGNLAAKWVRLGMLKENHGEAPSATAFRNSIYVCGGKGVEKYDISDDDWKFEPNQKISGRRTSIIGAEDCMYCIGVDNVGNSSQLFEAEWKYINPIRDRAFVGCVTVLGDLIYVVFRNMEIYCYNTSDDSWSKQNITNWPFQDDVKILTANENLYLLGKMSSGSNSAIYVLDPTTERLKLIEEIKDKDIIVAASLAAYIK